MAETTGLYYLGDGSQFIAGVPMRDLSAAEVAALNPWLLVDATTPNPGTGQALYAATKPGKSAPVVTTTPEPPAVAEG